jgi:hypothetical protein
MNSVKVKFEKLKPHIPTICFLCGSTWDTLTLRRIDNKFDLTILSIYLLLSAVVVILISRRVVFKFSEYLPAAAQFFFGGLFSACTVYYFKSTSTVASFVFIIGLACLLVGNEFLEKKYSSAQIAFTFWGICAAMILNFLVPVILHMMGTWVFLLSIIFAFLLVMCIKKLSASTDLSLKPVAILYIGLIVLFFLNVIPPVPLSKKQISIYRSVQHSNDDYICAMEKPQWYEPLKRGESTFRYLPGDTMFCYCSIFAPSKLQKKIYHHWYYKASSGSRFIEKTKSGYFLSGGRDNGYRGYTFKTNILPGKWKVLVKTTEGKTIGEISFNVVAADSGVVPEIVYVKN